MLALGLMSGTSLDGIDAALVETDGHGIQAFGPWLTVPYDDSLREGLRSILGGQGQVAQVARELTIAHYEAVRRLLAENRILSHDVALIGFHGHTILHRPEERRTWQIGYGDLLADMTGIDVVADFRSADVAAGGQGAPLVPLFHAALARDLAKPVAVLNIGGVANVTWIGAGEDDILAFDTGPGNALLDDWALRHTGRPVDFGGALAGAGKVDEVLVARLLDHSYFSRTPPKSLDRNDFVPGLEALSAEDGAATLTAFTARAAALAVQHFPMPAQRWLVCGGGRHNPILMAALAAALPGASVEPVEAVGWQGDALEAQAFAYLAVRSLKGLPLTLPGTTGVGAPTGGGTLFCAS